MTDKQIIIEKDIYTLTKADLVEQLARKTQECEKLEDFRTLTREVFTFGDSDVDDENFIKYLQEYSRSYEEAIDGYYRLTDITGIDYTVHGGADIEEIIKRVDILKQECEELKKEIINKNEKIKELRFSVSDLTNRLCYLNAEKSFRIVDLEQTLKEIEEEMEWVVNNRECYDLRDADRCERILDIINKAKGKSNG